GNDADVLRHDPMFKLAMGRLPAGSPLCSQSTISRLENRPDKRTLLRMGYGLIDLYCDNFRQVPRRIVLDIDDHFDAAHGEPEVLRFCRANPVDFVLGVATMSTLRRHILSLEQSTAKRFAAAGGRDKIRRFKEFICDAAAAHCGRRWHCDRVGSWKQHRPFLS